MTNVTVDQVMTTLKRQSDSFNLTVYQLIYTCICICVLHLQVLLECSYV
jgi:hypothetical protein